MTDIGHVLRQLDLQSQIVGNDRCTQAEAARIIRAQQCEIERLRAEIVDPVTATEIALGHELAAAKALADDVYNAWKSGVSASPTLSLADYRKARGM